MTKREIMAFKGTADDLEYGSDDYFAMLAYDNHGSAVRDNSKAELVAIGRSIEEEAA